MIMCKLYRREEECLKFKSWDGDIISVVIFGIFKTILPS